jgi:LCP family protein required for cell wall assembly
VPQSATRRHAPRARHASPRARWRRVLTALGVTFAVLLAAGSVSAFVVYQKLNGNITKASVDKLIGGNRPTKVTNPDAPKQPENILLLGSDQRFGKAAQNPNVAGARSDTTILLHLAADRKSAVGVSIPRDTIVPIPSCTRADGTVAPAQRAAMFNSAYSEAGAACTIKTVERLTDIRIDHYAVINFRGFRDMVNALGGVRICIPQDVNDPQSHLKLSKGEHTVWGTQALAYVRTRHALGNGGDLDRINRQQAFLGSMITKIKSKGLLLRPDRLISFLDAATKSLTTDPELGTLNALRKLATDVKSIDTSNVTFLTAPNEPYPADPNRVQLKPSAAKVWEALRFDRALPGKAPKPTATATPSGPPLVTPPENIKVEVLNGSGTQGAATKMAQQLTAAGFNVVGIRNADRSDYTTTTVLHDPAYNESGRTLGAAIVGSKVTEDVSLSSTLEVIVGQDNPQVTAVTVTGATSTPTPAETLDTRTANQNICS